MHVLPFQDHLGGWGRLDALDLPEEQICRLATVPLSEYNIVSCVHYGLKLIILCLNDAAIVAPAITFGPLRTHSAGVPDLMGLRYAIPEGSAAKQQGKQTDSFYAEQYLEVAEAFKKRRG